MLGKVLLGYGDGFNHYTEQRAVSSQGEGADLILDQTKEAWFIVEFFLMVKMEDTRNIHQEED